jgi:hypothetical protein
MPILMLQALKDPIHRYRAFLQQSKAALLLATYS